MIGTVLKFIPKLLKIGSQIPKGRNYHKILSRKEAHHKCYVPARQHAFDAFHVLKTEIYLEGEENLDQAEPVLFVGNHQSYFDVVTMLALSKKPLFFVAKEELAKLPIYSEWMRLVGCVFLNRTDPREAIKTIQKAVEHMTVDGLNAVIYPEGTRNKGKEMLEFKKGSFKLAQKANAKVVPIAIQGSYRIFEETGKLETGQRVYVRVLPAVDLNELSKEDLKVIHETLHDEIEKNVAELALMEGKQEIGKGRILSF